MSLTTSPDRVTVTPLPVTLHRLTPVDKIVFLYLAYVPLLVLALARPLSNYTHIFIGNAIISLAVYCITRFIPINHRHPIRLIRYIYPALLLGYFYNQTGSLMHIAFPDFFDSWFTEWERSFYGTNMTLWLDRTFMATSGAVVVTELLSFTYYCYYLMFPAVIIGLLVARRNELLLEILTACLFTFVISYQLFWLFPLEGPRWHFANTYTNAIHGPFFRPWVTFVINNGAVHGGCMPSTHTGVALVVLCYLYREYRKIFCWTLPIGIGIALGAVYGRFHYITDIFVGAAIAAVCTYFIMKRYPRWRANVTQA